jgi:rhodanese-related sulfurtransferase
MSRFLFIFFLLCSTSCANGQRKVESASYNAMLKTLLSHSVPELGVDSLLLIEDNVTLLDAREVSEFAVSHLQNAIHVGYDAYDSTTVAGLDKHAPIVVYCSVGFRSEKIAERLIADGFTNVSNLYGGIFEWKNQAGEIVDDAGPTERVHAFSRSWGIWLNEGEKVYGE